MIGRAVNEPPPFTIPFIDSGKSFISFAISSDAFTLDARSNNLE